MAKVKLTKGELKKQRDALKQFRRYLPTLQLKKQQLQSKILEVRKNLAEREAFLNQKIREIEKWVGLLADPSFNDLNRWIQPIEIVTGETNIAGAKVPVYEDVLFHPADYDYYSIPFWVDQGIDELRNMMKAYAEVDVINRQIAILQKELRTTTQRVNLFEKVKIPECKENMRKIQIYLGDQQANAVGVGKVAKKKIELKILAAV